MQVLFSDHDKNRNAGNAKKSAGRFSGITPKNKLPDTAGNEAIRPYKLRRPPTQSRANAARVIHVTIYRKKRLLVDHLDS